MIYTFNQYYLTTHLTRKASRDIYLAYVVHEPEHKVLLKIYDAECCLPNIESEDFQYLAKKFKRLSHPHIVPILDIGKEDGKPFVVTEYFPAGSLRQKLEQVTQGRFLLDTALSLILEIGGALSYAHRQNIVHQKIKPENVLLNAQGEALLADFSLHEIINEIVLDRKPDDRVISYMAPEQLTGNASPSSDQYALACLFYELITGNLPFTARDLSYLWQRYTIPSPTPPSRFVTSLPKPMESAILKALSKKPEDRYVDVDAFLAAIEEAARPAPPAFPFEHIIPHTGQQSAVRMPKKTPSPMSAVRMPKETPPPTPAAWISKETPPPMPAAKADSVQAPVRESSESGPLSQSFRVAEPGLSSWLDDVDIPSPYRVGGLSAPSSSEPSEALQPEADADGVAKRVAGAEQSVSSAGLFEDDDLFQPPAPSLEWLDDIAAPSASSQVKEEEAKALQIPFEKEEVELSSLSSKEKEDLRSKLSFEKQAAELFSQEKEDELAQLPFADEGVELSQLSFEKKMAELGNEEEEIEPAQLPFGEEEIELGRSSLLSNKEELSDKEEVDLSQLPFGEEEIDLTQLSPGNEEPMPSSLLSKEGGVRLFGKEEQAEHIGAIGKGERADHSELSDKEKKARPREWMGKEEQAERYEESDKDKEEKIERSWLNGERKNAAQLSSSTKEPGKRPESVKQEEPIEPAKGRSKEEKEQEEDRPSFAFLKKLSQRLDEAQKTALMERSLLDQKKLGVEQSELSRSAFASIPTLQPPVVSTPPMNPAPAPVAVARSVPGDNVNMQQPSVAGSPPVSAPPVASVQTHASPPVAQNFPLNKRLYMLLSAALICIVITALSSTANNSIISLMNAHASILAASIATKHKKSPAPATPVSAQPTPTVAEPTPTTQPTATPTTQPTAKPTTKLIPTPASVTAPGSVPASAPRSAPPPKPAPPPTPTPKPAPTPTPTPVQDIYASATSGTPLYSSPMSSDGGGWQVVDGRCTFANGGYQVTASSPGTFASCLAMVPGADIAFQARMTITSAASDGGGLIFRGRYRFRVGNGTYDLAGTAQTVSGNDPALNASTGQSMVLTVIAKGSDIYLYVNGSLLTHVTDSSSSLGALGMMAVDFSNPTTAVFTDVKVWKLS
jgi:serine/threonine protein kinase